jgi:SPP1 family predicted phage head-tail adaptor
MIGLLRNRVQLKTESKVSNGRGGWKIEEVNNGTRWAAIIPLNGRQAAEYMQLDKKIDTRIIMRRDPDISADTVIYFRDWRYRIDSVLDRLDHSDFIEILAEGEKING